MNLKSFSMAAFVIIGISFLPLINRLGFYLDDWPMLYSLNVRGVEGIRQYWIADSRPFASWVYEFFYPIFGSKPLAWHIGLFIARWITTVLFWLTFTKVWTNQKLQITVAALLFGIYPLFRQQSSGLMFTMIWVTFILYLLSLWLMVTAFQNKKWMLFFVILSLGIDLVSLLNIEYYIGIELLRPFIFFILINRETLSCWRKVLKALLWSLPWLVVDFGFLVWRAFLIKTPTLRSPIIFEDLVSSPIQTILEQVQNLIKDFIQITISVWYSTLEPALFDLKTPSEMAAWALALIALIVALVYILIIARNEKSKTQENTRDIPLLLFGALTVVLGAAPGWAIGRTVSGEYGLWNDRYGIAAMFGASLFLVGLVSILVKPSTRKMLVILAIFLALATGSNFRNTNEYRWSATYQTRFYNQLLWRAPTLKPNTTIFSGKELFPKMGVYPTSFALNLLYPSSNPMPAVDYWFYTIEHYFPKNMHQLDDGIDLSLKKWYVTYNGKSTDSLVIHWEYMNPSCLWVLDENDRYNPFISEHARIALGASNLSRIQDIENPGYPPEEIFGAEAAHGWCYYFEKADLARQNQEWEKITTLYDVTLEKGYNTNYGPELTPFIYGYALSGQLDKAIELTNASKTMAEKMKPYLCDQWNAIHDLAEPSSAMDEAYQREMEDLACGT